MSFPTPRAAVGVYAEDEKGRVLLVRRGPNALNGANQIGLPGGKIDAGEKINVSGARELHEETGLVASEMIVLDVVTEDRDWGPEHHFVTNYRAVSRWSGEARVMEPDKHSEILWLSPIDILEKVRADSPDIFPPLRDFVLAGGLTQARRALHGRSNWLPMIACIAAAFSLIMTASTMWNLGHAGAAAWMTIGGLSMVICSILSTPKYRPPLT